MTTPSDPGAMNNILRGRGRGRASAPAGQADPAAPTDPLAEAKQIAAEVAGQLDTLRKLLAKADTTTTNPFAKG